MDHGPRVVAVVARLVARSDVTVAHHRSSVVDDDVVPHSNSEFYLRPGDQPAHKNAHRFKYAKL